MLVIVEIAGGACENVYTEIAQPIVVVDWDNIKQGDRLTTDEILLLGRSDHPETARLLNEYFEEVGVQERARLAKGN